MIAIMAFAVSSLMATEFHIHVDYLGSSQVEIGYYSQDGVYHHLESTTQQNGEINCSFDLWPPYSPPEIGHASVGNIIDEDYFDYSNTCNLYLPIGTPYNPPTEPEND